jgi:hypothetical protein
VDTPVRVHDLSAGGCFINSSHDQRVGVEIELAIDLPNEGRIVLKATTLRRRPDFGYAVQFVDVPADTAARLSRVLDQLTRNGGDE